MRPSWQSLPTSNPYISSQAKSSAKDDRLPPSQQPTLLARPQALGQAFGVGIGLWFQALSWMRWLLLWLALASMPYIIVIYTAHFAPVPATAASGGAEGVTAFGDGLSFYGVTMAGLIDDSKDNGTLPWMQIQMAGSSTVHSMRKSTFLLCEQVSAVLTARADQEGIAVACA
jgi:hypothetical protein